jgi:hypothetical protein
MSKYTPTTDNVRNCYLYAYEQHDRSLPSPERDQVAQFDRWLAAHDAEAVAEIARLREVIAEITSYAEDAQIPSESDDDWIHADDILSILAKATVETGDER